MCRAMGLPMAPRPIMPVRITRSITPATAPSLNSLDRFDLQFLSVNLRAPGKGCGLVKRPAMFLPVQHDAVIGKRCFRRDVAFAHVLQYKRGVAVERVAEAPAARR